MSTTSTIAYETRPVSPVLGAEIVGVDLKEDVDEATKAALRQDFWKYKVLAFPGQHLSPDEHVRALRIFDEPFDHPLWKNRDEHNRLVYTFDLPPGRTADSWHIGGTWRKLPFSIESLTYQLVPELGGHTLWADAQAAYEALSEPLKQLLESVTAVYDAYPGDGTYDNRPPLTETVEQPVVLAHRHTGRKGLLLSSSAIRLNGVTKAESDALLPFLLRHVTSPNFSVSFGWRAGDFAIWDNLATLHYAVNDYVGPRVYRKVIGG